MKRTAAERSEEWRAVPAEVDLSRSSVERARYALGLLRAAVAARRTGAQGAPDFRGRPQAAEDWAV